MSGHRPSLRPLEVLVPSPAAREADDRRDWEAAREGFATAAAAGTLSAEDAFAWADTAWWLGRVPESLAAGEQAYRRFLDGDRPARAAMAAIHIAVDLLLRGDGVVGSGWLRRAERLLADHPDSVEQGYLTYLLGVEAALGGDDLEAVVTAAGQGGLPRVRLTRVVRVMLLLGQVVRHVLDRHHPPPPPDGSSADR